MASPWVLEYPAPTPPWSTNEDRTLHWRTRADRIKEWHDAAYWYAKGTKGFRDVGPSIVKMTLWFPSKRRRDPHNYIGTVVKATIDGFVAAGVWPDDTPEWVSVSQPVIEVAPGSRHQVTVRVEPVTHI